MPASQLKVPEVLSFGAPCHIDCQLWTFCVRRYVRIRLGADPLGSWRIRFDEEITRIEQELTALD